MELKRIRKYPAVLALFMMVSCGPLGRGASAEMTPRFFVTEDTSLAGNALWLLRDSTRGIEAGVSPQMGGELCSLRVRFRSADLELLYRGRDYHTQDGWRGKAPLLWPAVGRNFAKGVPRSGATDDCSYDYAGRKFELPIHGFARFKAWRVIAHGQSSDEAYVTLALDEDAESMAQYPFRFVLEVCYRLTAEALFMDYQVKASPKNDARMFFSIGNHITFRAPLVPGTPIEKVLVATPACQEFTKGNDQLPDGKLIDRPSGLHLPLKELRAVPAISYGNYSGEPSFTLSDEGGVSVTLSHHASSVPSTPFIAFNVWGGAERGYFSPEPWIGQQNSLNSQQGLLWLEPGETWHWRVRLGVETAKQ